KAQGRRGFYSLTVPTGGGKTLSSLGFALYHAVANEQKRVIYTIPFTSIIEQNAEVFARVLGRNNVVEHHSNYENPYKTKEELLKFQLAQENWYEPIIVTTNVQFFETLFSNKPSKVRKLHNISNSIIILDEIQSIPNKYIKPCLAALNELVINYDCTIVLCSATQPEYDKNKLFLEEVKIEEIIDDPQKLFKELRRTKEYYIGHQTIEDLAERLQSEEQALCIVNTKKHAKDLFEMLGQEDNHFHLSTHMYPVHRKEVISQIKELLQEGMPCKVISTQLIEAGVDIDFPKVYRSLSGIDSIVQAGGRCNREGKLEQGEVYVFKPEEKYIGKEYLALTAAIGEMCIGVQEDFLGLESISHYFSQLFDITTQKLDAYNVLGICEASLENPKDIRIAFEDLADNFKFIQNEGYPIIIPDTEQVEILLDQIKYSKNPKGLLRKLAPYTVTVKKYELDALKEYGALNIIEGNLLVLNDLNFYDHKLGLVITLKEDDFEYVI
ncbi:MAG: CRISPR-associated helicase Cas3', partial [Candidatus Niameybacter stercoravium]|nr:CRISPR-associated helicase Cas3' [Candidatus Niameybacter stercoravium]